MAFGSSEGWSAHSCPLAVSTPSVSLSYKICVGETYSNSIFGGSRPKEGWRVITVGDSTIISSPGVPCGVGELISRVVLKGSFCGMGEMSMASIGIAGEDVTGKGGVVT